MVSRSLVPWCGCLIWLLLFSRCFLLLCSLVCLCVCVCVCACVCACLSACVSACMRVYLCLCLCLCVEFLRAPVCLALLLQVPFGAVAFFPGRLVHTNEVTVLLGADHYAEMPACRAREIAALRKTRASQPYREPFEVVSVSVCLSSFPCSPLPFSFFFTLWSPSNTLVLACHLS